MRERNSNTTINASRVIAYLEKYPPANAKTLQRALSISPIEWRQVQARLSRNLKITLLIKNQSKYYTVVDVNQTLILNKLPETYRRFQRIALTWGWTPCDKMLI